MLKICKIIKNRLLLFISVLNTVQILFSKLRIKDFNDEPHDPGKIKLIPGRIQINKLFKTNDEIWTVFRTLINNNNLFL